jgi:hypothetical protein
LNIDDLQYDYRDFINSGIEFCKIMTNIDNENNENNSNINNQYYNDIPFLYYNKNTIDNLNFE